MSDSPLKKTIDQLLRAYGYQDQLDEIELIKIYKEQVGQLFAKENPNMVSDSVWSPLDYAIGFPIETKPGSIYKSDLLGVKQLELLTTTRDIPQC
jgi:hypothetical protein